MIAALFVESGGCYFNTPGIDAWDIKRDARKYDGPYPVVAHPPCQLWGRFAKINYDRWGFEHNKPGNDGGCFESALQSVRTYGGILEHPAQSYAWSAHSLTKPTVIGWQPNESGGWVCEVWQSAYGHKARKRTWLYYKEFRHVGTAPPELNWTRPPGTHQIGFHDQRGKNRNKPTISGKAASATPILFRDALIRLAESAVAHDCQLREEG
jgi:hypothetical protein